MLIPFLIVTGFAVILIALDVFKPQAARIILGIFFLLMALAVNLPLAITNPAIYADAGRESLVPFYRWFFTVVVAWNPPLFVYPLVMFEMVVGVLILSKGRLVKLGLLARALFCLSITPINSMTIYNPAISLALLLLIGKNFEQSVPEVLTSFFKPGLFSGKNKHVA